MEAKLILVCFVSLQHVGIVNLNVVRTVWNIQLKECFKVSAAGTANFISLHIKNAESSWNYDWYFHKYLGFLWTKPKLNRVKRKATQKLTVEKKTQNDINTA